MATQIKANDILIARVWCELDEQAAVNTYGYQCISMTGAGGLDQDLANTLDTAFATLYKAMLPPTADYRGTQVYFVNRGIGTFLPGPVQSTTGAGAGTATLPPIPRNSAAILKYKTVVRGPGGRGRVYLPFVSSDFLTTHAEPTTAFAVLLNSFASASLAPFAVGSGGNTSTMVWSLLRKTPGTLPVSTGQIVAAESAQKFGQMHKRGDYGRPNASPF